MIDVSIKVEVTPAGLATTAVQVDAKSVSLSFRSLHPTPLEAVTEALAYVNAECEVLLG